jgi:hypothetical protein
MIERAGDNGNRRGRSVTGAPAPSISVRDRQPGKSPYRSTGPFMALARTRPIWNNDLRCQVQWTKPKIAKERREKDS